MTAAVNQRRPFRIGVMGISVTAGHDCHHNEVRNDVSHTDLVS